MAMVQSNRCLSKLILAAAALATVPVPGRAQGADAPAAPALAAVAAPASARLGGYAFLTGGRTNYDVDCFFWTYCDRAHGTAVKLGGGYRFGSFGLEAWGADLGRGSINNGGAANGSSTAAQSLRLRALGVSAVWTANFGPSANGYLRVGGADVSQQRSGEPSTHSWQPTFGLGLSYSFTPQVALQLDWDATRAEGPNYGTTVGSYVTAGLRLRF